MDMNTRPQGENSCGGNEIKNNIHSIYSYNLYTII